MDYNDLRSMPSEGFPGARVLLRADLDVPVQDGKVTGGWGRVRAAVSTIKQLQAAGARVIVVAHRGRPTGVDPALSLKPVAEYMVSQCSRGTVTFAPPEPCERMVARTQAMANGDVMVLENVRFHPGEEKNDDAFAAQLSALADVYVNDAFGTCHRAHASTVGVAGHLKAYAGPTIFRELEALEPLTTATRHPYVAIIGGKKISSKLHAMQSLVEEADAFFTGGAIATTFFVAQGLPVGASTYERDDVAHAAALLKSASIHLPEDVLVKTIAGEYAVRMPDAIDQEDVIVDIGPESVKAVARAVRGAKMVVWNGPMGVVEDPASRAGTDAVAHLVAERSRGSVYGVVGGGDTVGILEELHIDDFVDHVSNGGSAMLEYVGHQMLPGLEALRIHN